MSGWAAAAQAAVELGNSALNIWDAKNAREATKQAMKKRYQWTVKDLMAAGLNPMLAVGGASPPVPSFQAGHASSSSNIGGAITGAKVAAAQVKNIEQDTATKGTQAVLNQATADKESAQAELARSQTGEAKARTESTWQGLNNLRQEVTESIARIEKMGVENSLLRKQIEQVDANVGLLKKETLLAAARGELTDLQIKELQGTMEALIAIKNSEAGEKGAAAELIKSPAGPLIQAYEKGGLPGMLGFLLYNATSGVYDKTNSAYKAYKPLPVGKNPEDRKPEGSW